MRDFLISPSTLLGGVDYSNNKQTAELWQ